MSTIVSSTAELEHFVDKAKPGDVCEYHSGFLMKDRDTDFGGDANVDRLATFAYALSTATGCQGLVFLFQKRVGDGRYQYLAARTAKRA